ncbi:mitochondrial ribosomal death-associated protein 3-domain-containing protein [Epithele typhae]|uniref:mitochondrial ribosomal death-associated protein 3-domain-containing protein n=1 Tax=Epithele typhae TaxID=378194 RepID=UPI002008D587|nr:mitochondrial ribosomal death-associated protein 3-domain-containing protein [Epithele typhae]KAH9921716.1 mitochondrial ribosomal death-associated protein 3-domain-containing protein [Epithele typhae]
MSLLAAARAGRSTPLVTGALLGQTRGYAAKGSTKVAQKKKSTFKKNSKTERETRGARDAGAFRAMTDAKITENPIVRDNKRIPITLPEFQADLLTPKVANLAMTFPHTRSLGAFGVPTNVLVDHMLLATKCSVVRESTLSMLDRLDKAASTSSQSTRLVISGKSGCGKSYLLLQATQYALQKQWITLYIPRAISQLDSSSSYAYNRRTMTYDQPDFAHQFLKRFKDVNETLLQQLTLEQSYALEGRTVDKSSPLMQLIQYGTETPSNAPTVLSAVLEELALQKNFPVLLAVDDFQALYCMSLYRDPYFKTVMGHHMTLPRTILEFASGKRSFARGAVLGAISTTDARFATPIEISDALGTTHVGPSNPYVRRDPDLVGYAKGLVNLPVPDSLTVSEAASVYELWQKTKGIHLAHGDETFMNKYTQAGGNARRFVQNGLLHSIAM